MALEIAQPKCFDLLRRSPRRVAIAQIPSDLLEGESVVKYERTHLPDGPWLATPRFESWVAGRNLFPSNEEDDRPIELRGLTCRQRSR